MKQVTKKLVLTLGILATATAVTAPAIAGVFDFFRSSTTPGGISPKAFQMAMTAYNCAVQRGLTNKPIVTIVDYTKPSNEKRLVVYDVANHRVLFNDLVAHGSGSGGVEATRFSNNAQTHASSVGVFLTGDTYFGKHGYSLRLNGMSHGLNDNALARDIVVHAANYVTKEFVKLRGSAGRSWGCLAVSPRVADELISTIKDHTVVFAYYPNQNIESKTPLMQCSAHA